MFVLYSHARDCVLKLCRYKRDDGIDMTATLYLPPGYSKEKDGPLPCLIWAYPREFKSKDAAGRSSFSCLVLLSPLSMSHAQQLLQQLWW